MGKPGVPTARYQGFAAIGSIGPSFFLSKPDLEANQDAFTDSVAVDLDQEARIFSFWKMALKRGIEMPGEGMESCWRLAARTKHLAKLLAQDLDQGLPLWMHPCLLPVFVKRVGVKIVCIGEANRSLSVSLSPKPSMHTGLARGLS